MNGRRADVGRSDAQLAHLLQNASKFSGRGARIDLLAAADDSDLVLRENLRRNTNK
jgi:hypothetical protein